MAKQLVSPVERHVEKVILGVAVLVLLGAVALYLVSSPNTVEIDGDRLTPHTVDAFVLAKAQRIRQRIRDAQVDVPRPEPLLEEFVGSVAPLKKDQSWPRVAALGVPAPFIDDAGAPVGQYALVEVVQLPVPKLMSGRSTFSFQEAAGLAFMASNWVTGSVVVDAREQSKLQQHAYGAMRSELLYGPVEAQRRAQRPDGTWSDDDWKPVTRWPSEVEIPEAPEVKLVITKGIAEVDPESARSIDDFYMAIKDSEVQLALLRPLPPVVENGDRWRFPILTTCRDVLAQDDEIQFPEQPAAVDPVDRYGLCGASTAATQAEDVRARTAARFAEGDRLMKEAKRVNSSQDAILAYNLYAKIIKDSETSPADKQKAKRLQGEAEQLDRDIQRRVRFGLGQQEAVPGAQEAEAVRQPLPIQQVWFTDLGAQSVQGGMTYQYRMRLTLLNRLVGDPGKFRDPNDATVVYVHGPWSEPSDPISIPKDVEFYLATEDSRDNKVGVKIFRWFDGVWVESKKFQVAVFDAVRGISRAPVPAIDDPTKVDRPEVPFDAGAVVLDLDFDRPLRERKKGQGRTGLRFADRVKGVCCAALVKPDGTLVERFLPVDKDNPSQRAAAARIWTPPN